MNTSTTKATTKRILIGVGAYANSQAYYSLPASLAAEVLPTGYYGWPDASTTSDRYDHPSQRRAHLRTARKIDDLATANLLIRGERTDAATA